MYADCSAWMGRTFCPGEDVLGLMVLLEVLRWVPSGTKALPAEATRAERAAS
jgi:hypothetical protein